MPRPGVEDRLLSPRRAPARRHVDNLAHRARCRVLPTIAYPTAFLVQQPGTVARYTSPSQFLIQVDVAHPLHSRLTGGGSRAGPGRGASPGPSGRDGGAALSVGLCDLQALGAHGGAHRVAVHHHAPAATGPW